MSSYRPRPPLSHPQSFFLSFEGVDGCGKSTQLPLVAQFFQQNHKTVHCLREPGGTSFGEQLRTAILGSSAPLHPLAEAHLFAAARAQLLHEKILPLLSLPHQIVLLDRYIDSSLVYQGIGRQLGVETIWHLHQHFPLNIVPHLTFYLEISAPLALGRRCQRPGASGPDYYEQQDADFFLRLIAGYQSLATQDPGRIKKIDGEGSIAQVFDRIKACLPASFYA